VRLPPATRPTTDQYLSIDPKLATSGQAYAYTGDNPLNNTDPVGLAFAAISNVADASSIWLGGGGLYEDTTTGYVSVYPGEPAPINVLLVNGTIPIYSWTPNNGTSSVGALVATYSQGSGSTLSGNSTEVDNYTWTYSSYGVYSNTNSPGCFGPAGSSAFHAQLCSDSGSAVSGRTSVTEDQTTTIGCGSEHTGECGSIDHFSNPSLSAVNGQFASWLCHSYEGNPYEDPGGIAGTAAALAGLGADDPGVEAELESVC
jgi:hypothetical protein